MATAELKLDIKFDMVDVANRLALAQAALELLHCVGNKHWTRLRSNDIRRLIDEIDPKEQE